MPRETVLSVFVQKVQNVLPSIHKQLSTDEIRPRRPMTRSWDIHLERQPPWSRLKTPKRPQRQLKLCRSQHLCGELSVTRTNSGRNLLSLLQCECAGTGMNVKIAAREWVIWSFIPALACALQGACSLSYTQFPVGPEARETCRVQCSSVCSSG